MQPTIPVLSERRPRIVRRSKRDYAMLATFLAAAAASGALGSLYNPGSSNLETQRWYAALRKSPLNPPPATFAPVWTTLYVLIAVAGWRIARAPRSRERSLALTWWSAQMAFNAAWSPLFFGRRSADGAMLDLLAMLGSIGAFMHSARRVDRRATELMIPYAAWVLFAGYLNLEVVRRNH